MITQVQTQVQPKPYLTPSELANAPVPTTFEQYQHWLHSWRKAYREITETTRNFRSTRTRYRNAGGFGRFEKNRTEKMTPELEQQWKMAYHPNYGHQLSVLRRDRKPIGAALYQARVTAVSI